MANYVRLAATTARLIANSGRTVTIVKYGNNPQDQEQPWRGNKQYRDKEVTGPGTFVPKTQLVTTFSELVDGTLMEGEYCLFAANNDGGELLELFDAIEDRGQMWTIRHVEVIAPADTRLLYLFRVER